MQMIQHAALLAITMCLISSAGTGSASARPGIFFYPPNYTLPNKEIIASPVTVAVDQVTTLFPIVPEMDGIVLILYWSQLCPTEFSCDFSMIDQVLSYWQQRGKRVVLSIATVGFPMTTLVQGQIKIVSATPDWVIARSLTYSELVRLIGSPNRQEKLSTMMPRYDDVHFIAAVQHLVTSLERYDGNPAVSQVRISAGLLGEDNPSPDGYSSQMPGFSPAVWLDYCRKMLGLYAAAFHKTQIEFDIGWISWLNVLGGAAGVQAADQFVDELLNHHALLAFNGLSSDSLAQFSKTTGPGASLRYLAAARARGGLIGLEAFQPLQSPAMSDVGAIVAAVNRLDPERLVLFGTEATALRAAKDAQAGIGKPDHSHPILQEPLKVAADRAKALLAGIRG